MKILKGTQTLKSSQFTRPVVTIGNFDGCHLGHQEIFKRTKQFADENGGEALVYTFDPHPASIVKGIKPQLIFSLDEKIAAIQSMQMDALVIAGFNKDVAATEPETFIREVIVEKIGAIGLVVGHDFVFGRANTGDIDFLREMGRKYGFFVDQVQSVMSEGMIVSSSCIRRLLSAGDVGRANRFMMHPYRLKGRVVHGMNRGRELGFPTANLEVEKTLIPAYGVYAAHVKFDSQCYDGILNIGNNPTFGDVGTSIEVFIFDFDSELYDHEITVELIDYIRGEIKFPDKSYLIDQMEVDCKQARRVLEAL